MNSSLEALHCMLLVCKNGDDMIGELQTLRWIETVLQSSGSQSTEVDGIESLHEIQERIQVLEKEMELK